MFAPDTPKVDQPKILIITLDAPDSASLKAGLYPNAIRQHVAIGLDVYVASIGPVEPVHHRSIAQLGAKLIALPQAEIGPNNPNFWTRLKRKMRLSARTAAPILDDGLISHIEQDIQPFCVLGLQSYQTGMVAQNIANQLAIPYLSWEHLSGYIRKANFNYPEHKIKRMFEGAYAVLGVSPMVIDAIKSRYRIQLENAVVLPNPIPEGFGTPPQGSTPSWMSHFSRGRIIFGAWTSWRNDNKRLDLLLDAFKLLASKRSDVALIVAGPYRAEDQDAIETRGLSDVAILTGSLSRGEIHHLAHFIDFCCVPSNHETFSLPLLEAMAAGRPTVSTACGGPDDILDTRELGRLVPVGDTNAFAEALDDVCRNDFNREFIAHTAESRYGELEQLARWRALYAPMLSNAHK